MNKTKGSMCTLFNWQDGEESNLLLWDLESHPYPIEFKATDPYFYLHKYQFDYDNLDKEILN